MVIVRKMNGSYKRTKEQNIKMVRSLKKTYEERGYTLSKEHRESNSNSFKRRWASGEQQEKVRKTYLEKYGVDHWTKSVEGRLKLSKQGKGKTVSKEAKKRISIAASKRCAATQHTHANGGFRNDLGFYVRSNWEANVARLLKLRNKQFEYEPFSYELIKNDGLI